MPHDANTNTASTQTAQTFTRNPHDARGASRSVLAQDSLDSNGHDWHQSTGQGMPDPCLAYRDLFQDEDHWEKKAEM